MQQCILEYTNVKWFHSQTALLKATFITMKRTKCKEFGKEQLENKIRYIINIELKDVCMYVFSVI